MLVMDWTNRLRFGNPGEKGHFCVTTESRISGKNKADNNSIKVNDRKGER